MATPVALLAGSATSAQSTKQKGEQRCAHFTYPNGHNVLLTEISAESEVQFREDLKKRRF
jgi:hypothetical protein